PCLLGCPWAPFELPWAPCSRWPCLPCSRCGAWPVVCPCDFSRWPIWPCPCLPFCSLWPCLPCSRCGAWPVVCPCDFSRCPIWPWPCAPFCALLPPCAPGCAPWLCWARPPDFSCPPPPGMFWADARATPANSAAVLSNSLLLIGMVLSFLPHAIVGLGRGLGLQGKRANHRTVPASALDSTPASFINEHSFLLVGFSQATSVVVLHPHPPKFRRNAVATNRVFPCRRFRLDES